MLEMQKVDYKPTFEELVQMVNHVAKVGDLFLLETCIVSLMLPPSIPFVFSGAHRVYFCDSKTFRVETEARSGWGRAS